MTSTNLVELRVSADSLPAALTIAVEHLIKPLVSTHLGAGEWRTASITAEAMSASELLPVLTTELTGLLDDFEAAPVEVSIHGLRWLPDSVRVWGTVTLARGERANPMEIDWLAPPVVTEASGAWSIEGLASIAYRT